MRLSLRRSLLVLVGVGASLPVLSCGNSLGPNGEKLVAVKDNEFDPASITIKPGETVLWQWKGTAEHNVTWDTQAGGDSSATQSSGNYSRTFSLGGTYVYYCSRHGSPSNGMHGVVVVQYQ